MRTKPRRAFFLWVAASAVALPEQAHACHQASLLLDNEPRAATTGAAKRPRLRVEEALIRKGGDPADHFAYRFVRGVSADRGDRRHRPQQAWASRASRKRPAGTRRRRAASRLRKNASRRASR